MDINLEYYKIFYYTAKQKSVTLAAEKLSISQPAVSQAIKHLEKDLGCALFVRTAKGVRLTKEGEMLFSYVERGCEAILSGEKRRGRHVAGNVPAVDFGTGGRSGGNQLIG